MRLQDVATVTAQAVALQTDQQSESDLAPSFANQEVLGPVAIGLPLALGPSGPQRFRADGRRFSVFFCGHFLRDLIETQNCMDGSFDFVSYCTVIDSVYWIIFFEVCWRYKGYTVEKNRVQPFPDVWSAASQEQTYKV